MIKMPVLDSPSHNTLKTTKIFNFGHILSEKKAEIAENFEPHLLKILDCRLIPVLKKRQS